MWRWRPPPIRAAGLCSWTAREARRHWAVVLDIDGVVLRGNRVIPGAPEAIRRLKEAGVLCAFMTNGGGMTEAAKAGELAALLGDESINESRVLLSHTPMRELATRYRGRRVLIMGGKETVAVAEHYGFDVQGGMAVTPSQVLAGTRGLCPLAACQPERLEPVNANADGPPIEAALLFYQPLDWASDLQVLTDVLAGGRPLGEGAAGALFQAASLYASNPDVFWQGEYPVPRFGMGAFLECAAALWRQRSGGTSLHVTHYGKPHTVQFRAAEQMLSSLALAETNGRNAGFERIYMVGDNPAADVRGANAVGEPWRSILVCTGVYRGGVTNNDPVNPAWRVEEDLWSAVDRLLQQHDAEHLAS